MKPDWSWRIEARKTPRRKEKQKRRKDLLLEFIMVSNIPRI
jgi:hypothetical protein